MFSFFDIIKSEGVTQTSDNACFFQMITRKGDNAMKKMILWTVLFLFAVNLALPAAAEAFWLKETYRLRDEMEAFGTHAVDENYRLTEEPFFGEDQLWLYEWYNTETGEFKPMGAYYDKVQEGWFNGGWGTSYVPYAEAPWEENGPACYCLISSNGKSFVPGNEAGPVVTYRVPVDGELSLQAALCPYGSANTSDNPDGGTSVYVYQNDTRIWPETEAQAKMTSDLYNADAPKEISVKKFKVKAGDRIRLVVACSPGTTREGKGTTMVDLPTVTWHSTDVLIGPTPYPYPPYEVRTENAALDGFTVKWSSVKNAGGYNLYLNGEKVNEDLIEGTEYTLSGLDPNTIYEVAVTSYRLDTQKESVLSDEILVRTKSPKSEITDSSENATATEVTDLPVTDTSSDPATDTALPTDILSDTEQTEEGVTIDAPSDIFITTEGDSSSDGSVLAYVLIATGAALLLGASAFFLLGRKKTDGQE